MTRIALERRLDFDPHEILGIVETPSVVLVGLESPFLPMTATSASHSTELSRRVLGEIRPGSILSTSRKTLFGGLSVSLGDHNSLPRSPRNPLSIADEDAAQHVDVPAPRR